MEIVVPVKQVPDLVEELEIDETGKALDRTFLKFRLNEFDEHALEEALVLKEKHGGKVTVIALDTGEVAEALYTCLAKGADRAIKVTGSFEDGIDSHRAARTLSKLLASIPYDLILTGVQAADDRDGQVGPLLASYLGLPHVSVVSGIDVVAGERSVAVKQEYSGGIMAEFEVSLPALLGVQAARQTPRYAPVSKVRQIMKTAKLEEAAAPEVKLGAGSSIKRLFKPEATGRAEIIEGDAEEVAGKLLAILAQKGFVKG
jgi:electron transfer flavoprotein beta subunit